MSSQVGKWTEQTTEDHDLLLPTSQRGFRINSSHHQKLRHRVLKVYKNHPEYNIDKMTVNLHAAYPGSKMPLSQSTLGEFFTLGMLRTIPVTVH